MSKFMHSEHEPETLLTTPMEFVQSQYAQEMVNTLKDLHQRIHTINAPHEIASETLRTVCNFYQGDWAGIWQADLTLNTWKPLWWYNCNANDKTSMWIHEIESSKIMKQWIESVKEHQVLYLDEAHFSCDMAPRKYEVYERLNVQSFLAVSLKPHMCGFLVVRNPKRYTEHSNMLQMLSYVANHAINEHRTLKQEEFAVIHPEIHHPNDVVIRLFGELEIYTCKGVLKEYDLHSLKFNWLLVYLILHPQRAHSATEIFEALGSGQNKGSPLTIDSIRNLIYRFRSKFGRFFEKDLIITSSHGYRINPVLRIKSDLLEFEQRCRIAQLCDNEYEKIERIKEAIELYKGPVYAAASSEPWLFHTANHYAMGYMEMINQLLELLAHCNDFESMNHYTSVALMMDSSNMTAYFWKIYFMYRTGAVERLQRVLKQAKKELTSEEYENLLRKVYSNGDQNLIGLMQ